MPNAVNEAPAIIRIPTAFIIAICATAIAATVLQVCHSTSVLRELGAPVDTGAALGMLMHDLVGFGLNFMGVTAIAFLIAFVVTALLQRVLKVSSVKLHGLLDRAEVHHPAHRHLAHSREPGMGVVGGPGGNRRAGRSAVRLVCRARTPRAQTVNTNR